MRNTGTGHARSCGSMMLYRFIIADATGLESGTYLNELRTGETALRGALVIVR